MRSPRWPWALVGALVLGALLWAGSTWQRARDVARLPPPPATTYSEAVAEHLRSRYAEAQREPTSLTAVGTLCLAYYADMYFDLAERCYALAAALSPDDWRWTYYRALIDSDRGGGEALAARLREVVRRSPRHAIAWLRLGDAEFKAGRYDDAAEAWRRARDLSEPAESMGMPPHHTEVPLAAYAALGLARVALARDESETARDLLEGAVAAAPNFGSAFRLLAESYSAMGRQADAVRAVARANRLSPYAPYRDPLVDDLARESRHSTLLLRLASEANLSINAEWSEYLTRRALEFDPDNPDVVVKLGRILRTVGRNEEALQLFQRYHEMVPGDYQGLAHIGSCLSALGRYGEAEAYLRRALEGLDDPVTHYNLGLLLVLTGRPDQAIGEYEAALERDPRHSDARMNLAAALARQGRLDRATRELVQVVEGDPENAVARTNLGFVLLQQGQVDRAERELTEALRLEPRLTQAADALASIRKSAGRSN